jgi:hypothetical protein
MRGLITQILTAASIAGAAEGWRADLYGEYGINDRWTLTAKSEAVTYPDFTEFDREALRLSIRRQLL